MAPHAIILRAAHRAAATVAEFARLGIDSSCTQLIETVWPQDLTALDERVGRLAAGEYQWVMLTSVSTVHVLAQRLAGRPLPPHTRFAAVGASTAAAAGRLLGREVDFLPAEQSAAGMVREFFLPPGTRVLYAHGDLASPTLSQGLRGWQVALDEVIAYATVPAGGDQHPVHALPAPDGVRVLDPQQMLGALPHSQLVVFAAPSIVRRFAELAGTSLAAGLGTIAIGAPTARAMEQAGIRVDATAADPTPAGLAACARRLLQREPEPGRHRPHT